MQGAPEFATERTRDAWAAIRGFTYQVDLTITRWLELEPGQILELERGEDIDLVQQSLTATPQEQTRLLEQVKHRTAPITLRTPAAVAALACAVEHRNANPGLTLEFRYTTNAQVTTERISLIESGRPGLTMWEEIREGRVADAIQTQYLSRIRALLETAECPAGFNPDTWRAFQLFIRESTDDELLRLIRCFTWSTSQPNTEELRTRILRSLISFGHARNESVAAAQYQRLFLHVFKVLSCPDVKRLSKDTLVAQLALPELSDEDHVLLITLSGQINQLEHRLGAVEEGLAKTNAALVQIQSRVATMVGEPEMQSSINYLVKGPILEPPPIVSHLSRRTETVNRLFARLQQSSSLAVSGGPGTGKTQLALLLLRRFGECRAWVRFRDLNVHQSYSRLIQACEILAGRSFDPLRVNWFEQICHSSQLHSVLVLDDLPRLDGSEELADCILKLTASCAKGGVRMITTSYWPFPSRFHEVLAEPILIAIESPALTDTEAREILAAHGAPQKMLNDKFVSFLNGLAGQHPALITASARYCRQRRWRITEQSLNVLIKGEHVGEVADEALARLLRTVEDAETREMLFRLNLIWGSFSQKDVSLLADIRPPISRAKERLHNLTGLWIQRDMPNRFSVSPLVKALGENFLNEQTRDDCHDALGLRLLRMKTADPHDIWEAYAHFFKAKEFGRAASVFIMAFNSLKRLHSLPDHRGLLDVWIHQPMPDDFELATRIYLRVLQVSVRFKFGKANDYLLEDLDRLIAKAGPKEGWAVLAAGVVLNSPLAESDPVRANRFLGTGLKLCPRLLMPTGDELVFPEDLGPETLFWTTVSAISTPAALDDWLATVEHLTDQQRATLFNRGHAADGCLALADKLWNEETKKPVDTRAWDLVRQKLEQLASWAERFGLGLLYACAVRAQITVLAEHQHKIDAALLLATSFLSGAAPDPPARFIVKSTLGRQYKYAGKNEDALKWLDAAFVENTDAFDLERIEGLLNASIAVGDKDRQKAISYLESAVAVAKSAEVAGRFLVIALAELAIARWTAGQQLASFFLIWEEAAEALLSIKRKDDSWRALYMVFGHASGFFACLANSGKPPEKGSDGEPFCAPARGMFLSFKIEASRLYEAARDIILPAQLAIFASGSRHDDRAAAWALRSIDATRTRKQQQVLPIFGFILIPHLLNSDCYANAVELAMEASAITWAAYEHEQQQGGKLLPLGPDELNVESTLGARPNGSWRRVEFDALSVGILPAALRINSVALHDNVAAKGFAREVQDVCGRVMVSASDPSLWREVVQLFDEIYINPVPWQDLIKKGNRFENQTLMAIAYLGASVQDAMSLTTACRVQLAVMPFVEQAMRGPRSAYRQIAAPFIRQYWVGAFAKSRFVFTAPRIVQRDLTSACNIIEEDQPRAILRTISNGLGIRPSARERDWLSASSTSESDGRNGAAESPTATIPPGGR